MDEDHPVAEPGAPMPRRLSAGWTRRDAGFRQRIVNVGHLLTGNGITGGVALIAVALTARALGPADYGILALVVSFVRVFDRLMRFESWQPLIKYAKERLRREQGG